MATLAMFSQNSLVELKGFMPTAMPSKWVIKKPDGSIVSWDLPNLEATDFNGQALSGKKVTDIATIQGFGLLKNGCYLGK